MTGESKVSNRGEDNEGGMSVEDLEGGFAKEVQSGEEGQEELGKKKQEDGYADAEVAGEINAMRSMIILIINRL